MGEGQLRVIRRVERPYAQVELCEGGYVVIDSTSRVHTAQEARELTALMVELFEEAGRKLRMVIDVRKVRTLEREARLVYQGEERQRIAVGVALVVDSGVSRVLGNFFIGLDRSGMKTRLFTSIDEACAWLASLEEG